MRAIDGDELAEFLYSESAGTEEQISDWIEECGLSDEEIVDKAKRLSWTVIEGFVNVVKTQPTLTPQNEPLTIEQLLGMNSTPLWVVDTTINRSEWCYWKNERAYSCEAPPEYYGPDDYGQWVAYRRPPEGDKED